MSGLEEQIGSILSDPEQMAQLQSLARSLMGPQESPPGEAGGLPGALMSVLGGEGGQGEKTLSRLSGLLAAGGGDDGKQALLSALGPYLSEKRREKLRRAMRLARMAKLAKLALGEMSDDQTL